MRKPKVGEMWQHKQEHRRGRDAFEYIVKIEDDKIYIKPVGYDGGCPRVLGISLIGFLKGYFYVQ